MAHVVLLGDSIFDNAAYVPGQPCVKDQVAAHGHQVTLLAVDGSVTADVLRQCPKIPDIATHLVVSVGGNDALQQADQVLAAGTAAVTLELLSLLRSRFRHHYGRVIQRLHTFGLPLILSTIYNQCPLGDPQMRSLMAVGLCVFNDVILERASYDGLAVLDLRVICTAPEDYSALSPIEPSAAGGQKIAAGIDAILKSHDWDHQGCRLYGGYGANQA